MLPLLDLDWIVAVRRDLFPRSRRWRSWRWRWRQPGRNESRRRRFQSLSAVGGPFTFDESPFIASLGWRTTDKPTVHKQTIHKQTIYTTVHRKTIRW